MEESCARKYPVDCHGGTNVIVDVGLIGNGRLDSPLDGVVGVSSLDGRLGQTIGVEASSVELIVQFIKHGIDDGHLAYFGLLDGLLAHHHLDTTAGVVVLLFELRFREVEGAHGRDAFDQASLPVGCIFVCVVGGPVFFVGHVIDGDGWDVGDQVIGRGEADGARLLLFIGTASRRTGGGEGGGAVGQHHAECVYFFVVWPCNCVCANRSAAVAASAYMPS